MRVMLSAVGTRGDVQPILALALKIRELGTAVRLCVPPNFVSWMESFGLEAFPVGVEMRLPAARSGSSAPLTEDEIRRLRASMPDLISDQFEKVDNAAKDCDVILGANAHQYAARSIAELHGLRYVTALYAPVAIPSPEHAPPPNPGQGWVQGDEANHTQQWDETFRAWNDRALERVNHNRTRLGLPPIADVLPYNITESPWLATDSILAPVPARSGLDVFATGAWILEDRTPLPADVEDFLNRGEPPIYFGFGSMPVPAGAGSILIEAVRSLGRRAIVSMGWADLDAKGEDCITIGDINQQRLFPRVAAALHHSGAGTTATAARAGIPQVILPMFSDQFYWAHRVCALGIGSSVVGGMTREGLIKALREALIPAIQLEAKNISRQLKSDGAAVAARLLVS